MTDSTVANDTILHFRRPFRKILFSAHSLALLAAAIFTCLIVAAESADHGGRLHSGQYVPASRDPFTLLPLIGFLVWFGYLWYQSVEYVMTDEWILSKRPFWKRFCAFDSVGQVLPNLYGVKLRTTSSDFHIRDVNGGPNEPTPVSMALPLLRARLARVMPPKRTLPFAEKVGVQRISRVFLAFICAYAAGDLLGATFLFVNWHLLNLGPTFILVVICIAVMPVVFAHQINPFGSPGRIVSSQTMTFHANEISITDRTGKTEWVLPANIKRIDRKGAGIRITVRDRISPLLLVTYTLPPTMFMEMLRELYPESELSIDNA
jgi:hypothetical protein